MAEKILKWAEILFILTIGLLAFAGMGLLMKAVENPLWSEEASGWAQAVGSVVAIYSTYHLFTKQREHEHQQARDDELERRFVAVQSLQDVTSRALSAMEDLHETRVSKFNPGVVPDIAPRLPELRAILDRFADPAADRVVVIAALAFSHALAETEADIKVPAEVLDVEVTSRMVTRIGEMWKMQDRLIAHMNQLGEQRQSRGISDDDHSSASENSRG